MVGGSGVVWVTGLPNSGKSTIADLVSVILRNSGVHPVRLDGDCLRKVLPPIFGYAPADRRALALFYAGLASELSRQGHLVIVSTVSLFHEVHEWNRRSGSPSSRTKVCTPGSSGAICSTSGAKAPW